MVVPSGASMADGSGVRISASWSGSRKTGCWTPYTSRRAPTTSSATSSAASCGRSSQKSGRSSAGGVPAGVLQRRRLAVAQLDSSRRERSWPRPRLGSTNRAGLDRRTNGGGSALAEKERIVRSAESSIIEITSPSRPANSAQAWAVLRSRSKSSISATHAPRRPSASVIGLGGELTEHPRHPSEGVARSPVLGSRQVSRAAITTRAGTAKTVLRKMESRASTTPVL